MSGEMQPVAWRVKDSAGGWMICSEAAAKVLIEQTGTLVEPLYSADALASRDAEIERLRAGRALADDLAGQYLAQRDAAEAERDKLKSALERIRKVAPVVNGSAHQMAIAFGRVKEIASATLSTLKTAREGDNA